MGIILMAFLFFAGIACFIFSLKNFKKGEKILAIVLMVVGGIMIVPPAIIIITITFVTMNIINR